MFTEFVHSHFNDDRSLAGGNFLSRIFGAARPTAKRAFKQLSTYAPQKKPLRWVSGNQWRKQAFAEARDDIHKFFRRNFTNRYKNRSDAELEQTVMQDVDRTLTIKNKLDELKQLIDKETKRIQQKYEQTVKALNEEPEAMVALKWSALDKATFDMMLGTRTPSVADAKIADLLFEMELLETCYEKCSSKSTKEQLEQCIQEIKRCQAVEPSENEARPFGLFDDEV